MTIIFILLGALLLISIIGLFIFYQYRRTYQDQKNYERGLEIIPLLIHLPPASEDIQASGRDVRDVVEENISKLPDYV